MAMLRAALYCRLSKDDMLQGDSESIKTQKAMLTHTQRSMAFWWWKSMWTMGTAA